MTCIAGSLNTIGNIALADRDVAFNQQINAFIPTQYEPLFLYYLVPTGHSNADWMGSRVVKVNRMGKLHKNEKTEVHFVKIGKYALWRGLKPPLD